MIRLRDLCAPAVALEWHEAVAVVAALTSVVWNARVAHAPTLDAAVLTLDGDVTMAGDQRQAGSLVSGLALTLAALLESTPCPAELRHLVTANLGPSPEIDSANAFARALTFFERPSRQQVLRQLAARAAVALERVRASEELERLTERARQSADESTPPERHELPPATPRSTRRVMAPAAAGMTVFLAVALAAATLFTRAQVPERQTITTGPVEDHELTPPESEKSKAAGSAEGERASTGSGGDAPERGGSAPSVRALRAASGGPTPERSLAVPPSGADVASPSAAPATTAPASAVAPGTAGPRERDVLITVTEMGGAPLPAVAARPSSASSAAVSSGGRVYTAADPGVIPAVLVKPHLPAEPPSDVPPWEVGTLELMVNTAGTVDQVHLISPYNRYQERMLVAAAKAWIFQPATRDGRPVRFRARIRVTL
jgi:hypothetical protein